MKLLLLAISFLCFIFNFCSKQNETNSLKLTNSKNLDANTSFQKTLQNTNNLNASDMKEAKFGNYNYHYKKEGEGAVALFTFN